jgi:protein-S-isoprenylcysteine O-methyltransferase Ste14
MTFSIDRIDWPALLIALIVGAYWARVIKLVIKTKRQTGKDANFVPPEPLGRALRIIWYPTVVVWFLCPLFAAFFHFPNLLDVLAVRWIGVAIAVIAFALTLVCWKKMGKSWRMGIDPSEKTQLIITGPYAYVRHPIYALSSIMIIGSVLAVPNWLMLVAAAIHIPFLQWEASREERYLRKAQGQVYEDYLAGTGRFVPRSLTPYSAR